MSVADGRHKLTIKQNFITRVRPQGLQQDHNIASLCVILLANFASSFASTVTVAYIGLRTGPSSTIYGGTT